MNLLFEANEFKWSEVVNTNIVFLMFKSILDTNKLFGWVGKCREKSNVIQLKTYTCFAMKLTRLRLKFLLKFQMVMYVGFSLKNLAFHHHKKTDCWRKWKRKRHKNKNKILNYSCHIVYSKLDRMLRTIRSGRWQTLTLPFYRKYTCLSWSITFRMINASHIERRSMVEICAQYELM